MIYCGRCDSWTKFPILAHEETECELRMIARAVIIQVASRSHRDAEQKAIEMIGRMPGRRELRWNDSSGIDGVEEIGC